jgi:hypothetical protein
MLCHTSNHWGHRNCEQKFTKIFGNNTRTTLNRFRTKTAILGTSHIIRKVLQAETWSLSGGAHHWLKRRSTREERKPVTRNDDNNNNNHFMDWENLLFRPLVLLSPSSSWSIYVSFSLWLIFICLQWNAGMFHSLQMCFPFIPVFYYSFA